MTVSVLCLFLVIPLFGLWPMIAAFCVLSKLTCFFSWFYAFTDGGFIENMDVLLSPTKWGSLYNGGSQCLYYMNSPYDEPKKRTYTCLNDPASTGRFITLVIRHLLSHRFIEMFRYLHLTVTRTTGKSLYKYHQ